MDDNQANLDVEELWSSIIKVLQSPPKKFWVSSREKTLTDLENRQKDSSPPRVEKHRVPGPSHPPNFSSAPAKNEQKSLHNFSA